ncbi:2-succinyl-6-hydroxy-2,4-cyclohexadiene-1-carboxylate synthase [Staphylococcus sp. SQ8-PEA]|uniref:Putative 2-succinyl-6-hydroxy-2,4-cyclohexadiene-1-carboxylate synthase n=1 Tax=Staphylococcus marylandisciuri TaxID=2981529 RepID=A0ABT2QPW8_9STAP|nr:2-succinyl-6-hydroxy-2,4-cyclohexadiene-1-carboxylate synthase [Staphylococcus marylandisciuri]MCU5746024.1 2-succinyl-6-hydroxy-2,4-cyclohexadiene-1-carboxylate synthase [Staphylococcus marylandisciuri]
MLNSSFYPATRQTNKLLVMLHGFISDQRTFESHLPVLTQEANVLLVDLPGHGKDDSKVDHEWNFNFINQSLDELFTEYQEYHLYLHGYSMGGRVALNYAICGKLPLKGLILESTTAGIKQYDHQQERLLVDQSRAKVLDIAGLEVFVNDWEKLPLFYTQKTLPRDKQRAIRQLRLDQDPNRLAKALRDYGTGRMPNLWSNLNTIECDTLILVGELDQKFCSIAKQLEEGIPATDKEIVSNVGHTINVEDGEKFDRIVISFLNKEDKHV